jgi:hypothetical protein|tara:strand:+ start:159 stop:377 length:219 start_codon:yes stop_codon:yes gene_type:complete
MTMTNFNVFNSLSKKDGKTKDRVETWKKNVHGLSTDVKKQVNVLENIDNGESTDNGRGEVRRDYFSMLVSRL